MRFFITNPKRWWNNYTWNSLGFDVIRHKTLENSNNFGVCLLSCFKARLSAPKFFNKPNSTLRKALNKSIVDMGYIAIVLSKFTKATSVPFEKTEGLKCEDALLFL